MEPDRDAPPREIVQQMILTFWSDGQFTVEGIPAQALLAYGMLGLAGEVMLKHRQEQAEAGRPRVVRPDGHLLPLLRGPR